MLKNLFIENIPCDEKPLIELLNLIGDDSWSVENIEFWVRDRVNYIYYSTETENYIYSTNRSKKEILDTVLTVIDYKDIINQKPIDELKINEVTLFKDANDTIYEVLRLQNGYIYTNKSGNMCFVPSSNILI